MEPIELLRSTRLFPKLSEENLLQLASLMKLEHHYPLEQIVHQGDLGNRFFVIASGKVSMRRTTAGGAESAIGFLSAYAPAEAERNAIPHNYFGEHMFSSQEPYDFHADAVTEVDVYRIHRKDFDELAKTHPHILHALDFIKHAERKRTHGYRWVGEGESLAITVHKHWWALVPALQVPVLILILMGIVIPVMQFASASQYILPFGVVAILAVVGWTIFGILDWYNDEYIVTNQRIIHVERNLFYQQELRDTAPIDKVQGVTIERAGIAGVLFGVATLVIQTPGREEGNVTFEYVHHSERIRAAILKQQEANRARIAAESREQFRATVRAELRQYIAPDVNAASPAAAVAPHKKKHRTGILGSIAQVLSFPLELEEHYDDRTVWRKHWILFLGRTKGWLAFQFAFIVLLFLTSAGGLNASCLLVGVVVLLASTAPVAYEWLDWRNDIYAVTENAIIDSERAPFGLKEKTTVSPLDQISDIVVDIPNFLATILDYGTLKIDTAGKSGEMIFQAIHEPRQAQQEIYQRIAAYKAKRAREDASIRSASVVDAILAYHRLQLDEERARKAQSESPPAASDANPDPNASERNWKIDEPKPGSENAA